MNDSRFQRTIKAKDRRSISIITHGSTDHVLVVRVAMAPTVVWGSGPYEAAKDTVWLKTEDALALAAAIVEWASKDVAPAPRERRTGKDRRMA